VTLDQLGRLLASFGQSAARFLPLLVQPLGWHVEQLPVSRNPRLDDMAAVLQWWQDEPVIVVAKV
jgi:hypothetical protein